MGIRGGSTSTVLLPVVVVVVVVVLSLVGNTQQQQGECLYFTFDEGAFIVAKPIDDTLVSGQITNSTTLSQFKPTAIESYNDILYVAASFSIGTGEPQNPIMSWSISNALATPQSFFDFTDSALQCDVSAMVAHNDLLYVSCLDSAPSILKISLASSDYGSFVGASNLPAVHSFSDLTIRDSNFVINNAGSPFSFNGPVLFMTEGTIVYAALLNTSARSSIKKVYQFADDSFVPPDTECLPPYQFQSLTFGSDGSLYVIQQCNGTGLENPPGKILRFDGSDGTFLEEFYPPIGTLMNPWDIILGPTGALYVSLPTRPITNPSRIWHLANDTTTTASTFLLSVTNQYFHPRSMVWASCPFLIPPAGDGSGSSSSSSDSSLIIALATAIPIIGACLICCCLLGILLGVILGIRKMNQRRRKEYDDEGLNRIEMGRRGVKKKYTYKEIDPDELQIGEAIGSGAFGQVYKGSWRGATVAIKTFAQIKLAEADEETLAEIREEAQMMEKLGHHPNVIGFIGAVTKPSAQVHELYFSLVTEFCPNGSLFDLLIKKKHFFPLPILVRMARDIAAGIEHLHKERVIHRDIATRNVLVGENYAVYISDFGLARIKQDEVGGTTLSGIGPIKWMAPEALKSREYSEASDAFSYGVLLWEMVTRKEPWKGMDPSQVIFAVVRDNTRLKIPKDCSPVFKKIIQSVWHSSPQKRMKMGEIHRRLDEFYKSLADSDEEMEDESSSSSAEQGDSSSGYNSQFPLLREDGYQIPSTLSDDSTTSASTFQGLSASYVQVSVPSLPSDEEQTKKKQKKTKKSKQEISSAISSDYTLPASQVGAISSDYALPSSPISSDYTLPASTEPLLT